MHLSSDGHRWKRSNLCMQEEAREAVASPVEAIADSLDEGAAMDDKGGGKLASAIRGEFGEYDFDDAQLQVCLAAG